MKLIRFRENGTEKPGIFLDEQFFDVSSFGEEYNETFFETRGLRRLETFVAKKRDSLRKLEPDIALGAPFQRPSKIVCIGLNYADHAKETGATPPAEPVIFLKATTSLAGPSDPIVIPKGSV